MSWTVVLENTESPLDCKEMKPVHPEGNQSWIFIGRIDAEAEAPILRPPDSKNWLIGKDPDDGKDWRKEKRMTEDEMVGWHHRLDGHEFEQALGVGDEQESLVCCTPWGRRVRHDWVTELNWYYIWNLLRVNPKRSYQKAKIFIFYIFSVASIYNDRGSLNLS